jgi:outer membrane immunogenic protein
MKKSTVFAAALAAAFAIPAAAQTNWTGFHAGVNIGHASGGVDETPDNNRAHQSLSGKALGAQMGYDYQFPGTRLVLGFEADVQKSNASGERFTNYCPMCSGFSDTATTKTELNWFGTARLRAGYAFNRFLPYATLGAAAGSADSITVETVADKYGSSTWMNKTTQGAVGYAAGVGVDWAATPNFVVRVEYLHTKLGMNKVVSNYSNQENNLMNNTLRLGLNYKF